MGGFKKKERQDETQFTTKIGGEKLVWVQVISFGKIFLIIYVLMPSICQNWPFLPPYQVCAYGLNMPKLAVLAS